ncbi:putative major capsid protein [Pseudoalteromonas phage PH357]|nr:putative major capsid protein [Pseudoalteromonas phage PH357]
MARMGDFGVVDYTSLMALSPRKVSQLEVLGIFNAAQTDYIDGRYAEFEREKLGKTKMYNVSRDADRQFMGSEQAQKEILEVPFATLDGVTRPAEVENFRMYGTEDQNETVENVVNKKIAHIQRSHAGYEIDVAYQALLNNKVYAFNEAGVEITGLAKNFSTVWGAARKTGAIDLTNAAVNPFDTLTAKRAEIIAEIGEQAAPTGFVYIVNSVQFGQLVSHPLVEDAYNKYPSEQEPLRRRLAAGEFDAQTFSHKGITVVEDLSGKLANTEGYLLPLGVEDMFVKRYAPANTIEDVNTVSKGSYLFMRETWRAAILESEIAVMCMITRPELICDVTATVA